jgi:hypothetical protein
MRNAGEVQTFWSRRANFLGRTSSPSSARCCPTGPATPTTTRIQPSLVTRLWLDHRTRGREHQPEYRLYEVRNSTHLEGYIPRSWKLLRRCSARFRLDGRARRQVLKFRLDSGIELGL